MDKDAAITLTLLGYLCRTVDDRDKVICEARNLLLALEYNTNIDRSGLIYQAIQKLADHEI